MVEVGSDVTAVAVEHKTIPTKCAHPARVGIVQVYDVKSAVANMPIDLEGIGNSLRCEKELSRYSRFRALSRL
jgi:hypothetical protein